MKKSLLPLLAVMLISAGCAKKATAPVPGSLNTFDAYSFRVLADAQAALNAFKADVGSGKVPETPAVKQYLNDAITDYNVAEVAYQAWHAAGGAGSTIPIASAISKVQTDISNIASVAGK